MSNEFAAIFERLKSVFKEYESSLAVKSDESGKYYLISKKPDEKKKEIWFGGVEIKKNYVSFHLVPLYFEPKLLDNISPELKKRLTGKSCFNFKKTDETVFGELADLTQRGFEEYRRKDMI